MLRPRSNWRWLATKTKGLIHSFPWLRRGGYRVQLQQLLKREYRSALFIKRYFFWTSTFVKLMEKGAGDGTHSFSTKLKVFWTCQHAAISQFPGPIQWLTKDNTCTNPRGRSGSLDGCLYSGSSRRVCSLEQATRSSAIIRTAMGKVPLRVKAKSVRFYRTD